jgi:hypothetical protein
MSRSLRGGTIHLTLLSRAQIERRGVLDVHVEIPDGREVPVRQAPGALLQWLLFHYMPVVMLAFFLALTFVLVVSFLGYHLWLTFSNTTTNEAWKRKDLRRYLMDVAVADAAEAEEEAAEAAAAAAAAARGGDAAPAAAPAAAAVEAPRARAARVGRLRRLWRRLRGRGGRDAGGDAAAQQPPPPPLSAETLARIEAQCRNIYDRGALQNFLEVLFPRSERRECVAAAAAAANKRD